jgi:S-adenosyl methyltransferase
VSANDQEPRPGNGDLDTKMAYSARVNNYWHGGKDNFAKDREAAEQALEAFPELPVAVRAGVRFRTAAVTMLVRGDDPPRPLRDGMVQEQGLRQFLDLGTGLPAGDPIHRIAQALAPDSRVVYVDNDPMVISHARALFPSGPEGACGYVHGDVRDIDAVLAGAGQTLDFTRPVAIFLSSLLHLIPDSDDPYGIVRRAMAAVASGSHLVIVHPASDIRPEASTDMAARLNQLVAQKRTYRSQGEVTAFFDGLRLVPPGVVPVPQWRPDSDMAAQAPTMAWCAVARKP